MKKEISRNPSFTPSPKLRNFLSNSELGVTRSLNELFDRYSMMIELDAIRLTESERFALAEHLQGVLMDVIAIQSVPQDVIETECDSLIEKMQGATFGQVLATLVRYELIK
ncbi:hypothetical protein [Litoribrevibacter albus]|uniref:Uncharacterized protein n=1 Tax=Litoribrevibacter albus TaxID=1473156 RepID=A0AA37W6K4_9GAMM|nr:hypothetical protein [Litoribrevibacter albus]GLQ31645.1 hypothetical protein GCM10007876_21240 [Litoribrevibacter albus]